MRKFNYYSVSRCGHTAVRHWLLFQKKDQHIPNYCFKFSHNLLEDSISRTRCSLYLNDIFFARPIIQESDFIRNINSEYCVDVLFDLENINSDYFNSDKFKETTTNQCSLLKEVINKKARNIINIRDPYNWYGSIFEIINNHHDSNGYLIQVCGDLIQSYRP